MSSQVKPIIHQKADKFGNMMLILKDPVTPEWIFEICLYIDRDGKRKTIAILDAKNRLIYLKRERGKHLHVLSNSYGFNEMLVSEALSFDTVHLSDEFGVYKFPKGVIAEHGQFVFFKQQGFEKQLFVPLPILSKYSVTVFKNPI